MTSLPLALQRVLATAERLLAHGAKPVDERRVARLVQPAMAAGLLGITLLGVPPAGADSRFIEARATGAGAVAHQVRLPRTTAIAATWVMPGIDERAGEQVGWLNASGQVDAEALLNGWKDAGISPHDAAELINVLMLTQSPVLARTNEVRMRAQQQADTTRGVFDVQTPQQAKAFLRNHSVERLVWAGVLHSDQAFNTLGGDAFGWGEVAEYWTRWASKRYDESMYRPEAATPAQMTEARQRLAEAAEAAGLAGLRVPLASWTDPPELIAIAKRLKAVNRNLSSITGLDGPVLGLNGRVELMVTSPRRMGLTYSESASWIGMAASWEDLPHEWFHTLDFALRRSPVDANAAGGATLTQELDAERPQSEIEGAWQRLSLRLEQQGRLAGFSWHDERRVRVAKLLESNDSEDAWRAAYLQRRHEVLAFQWQAFVQTQLSERDVSYDPGSTNGVVGPRPAEAKRAAPVWRNLMRQIEKDWWAPQLMAGPSVLTVSRSMRQAPVSVAGDGPRALRVR